MSDNLNDKRDDSIKDNKKDDIIKDNIKDDSTTVKNNDIINFMNKILSSSLNNNGNFPIETIIPIDLKIEHYNSKGEIKSEEQIIFNKKKKDSEISSDSEISADNEINNNENKLNKKPEDKSNKKYIENNQINTKMPDIIAIPTRFLLIDYASLVNDEKSLDKWLKANLDTNEKFIGNEFEYSYEAITNASTKGNINILDWWLNAHKKHDLPLKYNENAINLASAYNKVKVLEWWLKSELELKYDEGAIDLASNKCSIDSLNWWLDNYKNNKVKFLYTSKAIDNAKLDKEKYMKLIKWWNSIINNDIKFKYSNLFIEYLEYEDLEDVFNYAKENEIISNKETYVKKSYSETQNTFNIFDMFGLSSIKNNKTRTNIKNSSSSYDISGLPEDIQNHIREKEEELNNNMLINGKAKEYIDNLIKIPFGKYKSEKIFVFLEELIKKINELNKKSENELINSIVLNNESDLIKFFDLVKIVKNLSQNNYKTMYNIFCELRIEYLKYVDKILDDTVYGHELTKKHIKCIITQWLSGGFKSGVVIGIQGPPGVGKTTLIKGALSKCLVDFIDYDLDEDEPYIKRIDESSSPRPFCFLSLGGTTNGSTLIGHNITYHGATSGDIVKNLKEAKIMNPILYFDELDKISNTEHGHEISSVLTHITDPVQNSHFIDRYFSEVKIDLSKCIIVFSYNDSSKIDRILLDRIQEIRLNPIKLKEKLIICRKFIIPEICNNLGYNETDINISDKNLISIISEYTLEAGVRKLKEKLFEIFRMYHMETLKDKHNDIEGKIIISDKFVNDTFSDYPKVNYKKIGNKNEIGSINGLYASSNGLGGITIIQVKPIYHKENLGISITGSIEKVMNESVQVARTVAWNLLSKEEQDGLIKEYDGRGLHIHFPDGATPKDGPSGGTAITCAIYSLFTKKAIKKNIAITGEIDLNGNVTEIGGLDAKLNGAKRAGVNTVLIPQQNQREFDVVIKNNPEILDKKFKVIKISTIQDALKYIF
jgi:hypothetical protein